MATSDQLQSQASTRSLLRRGRSGDARALDRLFGRVLIRLRRWVHGRLPSGARDLQDTADVVQDAAIRVWRRLDHIRVERPGDLDAYLRQAARNRIRDEARRVGRRPELAVLDVEPPDGSPSPLDQAMAGELLARDQGVWGRLTPDERELLVARYQFGYSYDEIAQLMSRPSPAAARMAVNRVVARLRVLIVERDAARRAPRAASH